MSGGTEVVAVWVEERIRTYGFDVRSGLTLVTRALGAPETLARSHPVEAPEARDLLLATAQQERDGALVLQLLLQGAGSADPGLWDIVSLLPGVGPILQVVHPVEAVFFHGPHFGDRHGIAAAAFEALAQGDLRLHSVCCAGASVCLVVGKGQGRAAVAALRTLFEEPEDRTAPSGEGAGR